MFKIQRGFLYTYKKENIQKGNIYFRYPTFG